MARILLISGSLREGSVNVAVLRTARVVAPQEIATTAYAGLGDLPHFNPDDDHDPLPPAVVVLRAQIDAADALLFCTPEYAGALPGALKNLLDWTVGGMETVGKPAGWINASSAPAGAAGAHAELRTVLGYTGALPVDAACAQIPVPRSAVDADGRITVPETTARIAAVLAVLTAAAAEVQRASDR